MHAVALVGGRSGARGGECEFFLPKPLGEDGTDQGCCVIFLVVSADVDDGEILNGQLLDGLTRGYPVCSVTFRYGDSVSCHERDDAVV